MPTALERGGDFSQTLHGGKLITITDPTTGQPFAGNVIPKNRLDSNGQALLSVLPMPNITNTAITKGVYNYDTQFSSTSPTQLYLLKLDFNMSSKDSLSMTWDGIWQNKSMTTNGGQMTAQYPLITTIGGNIQGMASANYRHIFSPTMVNEFSFGYAYTDGPLAFQNGTLKNLQRSTYGFNAGQLNPVE